MRHRVKKFTLGRKKAQRKALLRNLAQSLVLHGAIRTTSAKAKALRTVVEPLVTRARRGTLADRREIAKVLYTQDALRKMMDDIGPKYKERPGGYTRIIKVGHRPTDGADVVRIEFV
ncbi:MAG: 50S ribosomal protein L17 [Candidatus Magasanikbacteria bacterium CG10_big_fil_rev_8_21_14_0_10_43_6]|uniref:Large ribosomal subunit protein bL17 n=1 Tax=Candidatus Magasanikbacteria bacterium CG10_big_fil_rev_8_21_14_0_10_43_6 TaxID=1974650 RepID=A0A2M6W1I6_9BACT|nr:MAG: 50S ribosomal protein L17 [Candidatus Magasanikbacteria bacterium CG10_big_fil_rev_8_21_14_0_10_43_6]